MAQKLSKDDAYEVSDSTDWLETPLKSLSAVDSALRCQVCKDFYTTPMITSCAHTFCSLCIRRCLSNDGKCPACRTNDQELKLRFNAAMEELVQAFVSARPEVLEFAKKPIHVGGGASPKRRREETELEDNEGPRKRTRSSGRVKSQELVVVVDSDVDGDEDYMPEAGYVLCPVCSAEVKEEAINAHLDRNCDDEPTKKAGRAVLQNPSSTSQKTMKPPERLPHVNYSMLKDGPLRKKLIDQGLSAVGARPLLMKRYTEWVTLWNANCDATRPKNKAELRREMDVWERTQGGRAPVSGSAQSAGAQIRDKDFDGSAWATKHETDFQKLIANARRKPPAKVPNPDRDSNEASPAPVNGVPRPEMSDDQPKPTDVEMENGINEQSRNQQTALPILTSSEESSPSKSRFFQEGNNSNPGPVSSQYSDRIAVDKKAGIASDITT